MTVEGEASAAVGFHHILDGMNAERIAAECVGDGRFFSAARTVRTRDRRVSGRPIGQNQSVAFSIATAYAHIEAGVVHQAVMVASIRGRVGR